MKFINWLIKLLGGTTAEEARTTTLAAEATEAALGIVHKTGIRQILERAVDMTAEETAALNATVRGSQDEIDAAEKIMNERIAKAEADFDLIEGPALEAIEVAEGKLENVKRSAELLKTVLDKRAGK